LIRENLVTAVHDLSDGGLAVALAEMAMASGIGAGIDRPAVAGLAQVFFGEDQGRYLLTVDADRQAAVTERAGAAGVSLAAIGRTGGDRLVLGDAEPLGIAVLRERHEAWFPRFMGDASTAAVL
jgi:phosphoribosylformylglycinamidine synthase